MLQSSSSGNTRLQSCTIHLNTPKTVQDAHHVGILIHQRLVCHVNRSHNNFRTMIATCCNQTALSQNMEAVIAKTYLLCPFIMSLIKTTCNQKNTNTRSDEQVVSPYTG